MDASNVCDQRFT
ncbi:unnamed protein product [Calypogeia fissa]